MIEIFTCIGELGSQNLPQPSKDMKKLYDSQDEDIKKLLNRWFNGKPTSCSYEEFAGHLSKMNKQNRDKAATNAAVSLFNFLLMKPSNEHQKKFVEKCETAVDEMADIADNYSEYCTKKN